MNGTLLLIYVIGILINIFYIKYKNGMNRFKFDTTILLMYISYLSWIGMLFIFIIIKRIEKYK